MHLLSTAFQAGKLCSLLHDASFCTVKLPLCITCYLRSSSDAHVPIISAFLASNPSLPPLPLPLPITPSLQSAHYKNSSSVNAQPNAHTTMRTPVQGSQRRRRDRGRGGVLMILYDWMNTCCLHGRCCGMEQMYFYIMKREGTGLSACLSSLCPHHWLTVHA